MEFVGTTKISSDEYHDLCERVAIAEERIERLWDYIEQEDMESAEQIGNRSFTLRTETVKLITGYTEKMTAAKYIIDQIDAHEEKPKEEEGDENGESV